jgi:nucleoside-diphosphate-sugar epimerase
MLVIGRGYLGDRVVNQWAGEKLYFTTRNRERAAALERVDRIPVVCDVTKPETLTGLPQVDWVLYAVGLDRSTGQSMRDVYIQGLANVLDRLPPPKRLVYISSTSVYGQQDGEWVDENAVTEPAEESGRIVLEAESVLRAKIPAAMILRFAGIYGPKRLLRLNAVQSGEPIGGEPDRWLNLIHVVDGVQAVYGAFAHGKLGGIYNVADGHPCRRREFYGTLANLLGAPEPHFVPRAPGQPPPRHDRTNRQISNKRMVQELKVLLGYPDFSVGLTASVGK